MSTKRGTHLCTAIHGPLQSEIFRNRMLTFQQSQLWRATTSSTATEEAEEAEHGLCYVASGI